MMMLPPPGQTIDPARRPCGAFIAVYMKNQAISMSFYRQPVGMRVKLLALSA
jgi:hypothetical protein